MNLSDLEHLDETIAMLHDIRDVYAEWEQAHEAWFNPADFKNPANLDRYEKATRAMVDKRTYWAGIEQYIQATSTTVAAPTAEAVGAASSATAGVN